MSKAMDAERQRLANAIFLEACELPSQQVEGFLKSRCAADLELMQRVAAMLDADGETDAFLEMPTVLVDETPASIVGERGYKLLRLLGEGGMGRVYLAERADGAFKQQVAIKLLQGDRTPGRDALRRFRAERQILAALAHPNIARLLDGGTLADGAPYLVMEYIEGERLDHWCAKGPFDLRQRIDLFLKICDAVQFAHQALIVHRDLKPSNILVTPQGEPKLLDFGIAKVLNADAFGQSLAETRTGIKPMTLAYASPEQVRGEIVGTGSDVYSLGVVLYELLTGMLPYRALSSDPLRFAHAVCEEQPEAPSRSTQRLERGNTQTGLAARPGDFELSGPSRRQLSGDLDAIVLKALRKEAAARYGSVEQLAADMRRYLDGLPVLARRGNNAYRLRKFVIRQRWPLAAATLVFFVLSGSVLLLRAQLARTEMERDKAEHVADFIVRMFERSDPAQDAPLDPGSAAKLTVREVMDDQAPRIASELGDSPEVQANLLSVVSRIYGSLGLPEPSLRYGEAALEQLRRSGQIPSRASVRGRLYLLETLNDLGQFDQALAQAELALVELATLSQGDDFDRARALRARGAIQRNLGHWDLAGAASDAALAMFRRIRGAQDVYTIGTLKDLATIAEGRADYPGCVQRAQEGLALVETDPEASQQMTAALRAIEARCLAGQGDLRGAETALRAQVEQLQESLGLESVAVAAAMNDLGNFLNSESRYAEAEPILRKALSVMGAQLGTGHASLATATLNLSTSVFEQGRRDEGIALQLQGLALVPESQRQNYAVALNNLGYKLFQMGRIEEAEQRFREALAIFDVVAPQHPSRALTLSSLGRLLIENGRAEEAQSLIEAGLALRLAILPADHWAIADSRSLLGACLLAQGLRAEAEPLLREGLAGLLASLGPTHARSLRAQARVEALTDSATPQLDAAARK